ncbi:hypothetical protein ACTL6P_04825 [Endozoicomonas acroporae]|uniref:hypothetical protein n=1 Tax=Endozoicomonas acroporae TaxID=1701104 RepID=UPI000C764E05|nr:hypothetical protein [Endozoicomonas acroporae]
MDAVTTDLNRHLSAMDTSEAFETYVESELDRIETGFQTQLESGLSFRVNGFGVLTLTTFVKFLTTEEFHPMQGYRWLAVKQLVSDCNDENSRLSGWDIINYASKRGYCRG